MGNELADEAAKEAAALITNPVYTEFPLSYAKRHINQETTQAWHRDFIEESTGSGTKIFFQSPSEAEVYSQKLGISFEMTQCLTGHSFCKAYLKRFKIIEEDSCPCDSSTSQTISHLLLECPCYERARRSHAVLCEEFNIQPFSIKEIARYKQLIESFNKFVYIIISSLKSFNAQITIR